MEQKIEDIDIDIIESLRQELWKELSKVGVGRLEKFWTVTWTENERKRQYEMAYFRATINACVKMMSVNRERGRDKWQKGDGATHDSGNA